MVTRQGSHCPLPHDIANHRPKLGVSALNPSPTPRPLTELLGVSDRELQEQMAKSHPYVFNMGHGQSIQFKDFKEAAEALMERNMPDILHDRQTEVVYLPETHLPTMPRVVDLQRFQSRKSNLDEQALLEGPTTLDLLGMRSGRPVEVTQAKGNLVEKELAEELRKFFEASSGKITLYWNRKE